LVQLGAIEWKSSHCDRCGDAPLRGDRSVSSVTTVLAELRRHCVTARRRHRGEPSDRVTWRRRLGTRKGLATPGTPWKGGGVCPAPGLLARGTGGRAFHGVHEWRRHRATGPGGEVRHRAGIRVAGRRPVRGTPGRRRRTRDRRRARNRRRTRPCSCRKPPVGTDASRNRDACPDSLYGTAIPFLRRFRKAGPLQSGQLSRLVGSLRVFDAC